MLYKLRTVFAITLRLTQVCILAWSIHEMDYFFSNLLYRLPNTSYTSARPGRLLLSTPSAEKSRTVFLYQGSDVTLFGPFQVFLLVSLRVLRLPLSFQWAVQRLGSHGVLALHTGKLSLWADWFPTVFVLWRLLQLWIYFFPDLLASVRVDLGRKFRITVKNLFNCITRGKENYI